MLEARQLSFSYAQRQVLREVSLAVQSGEVLVLLGPNGCGKTTLLKNLSGVLRPSHGVVLLESQALASLSPRDAARKIAAVEQDIPLGFDFRVEELVTLGRLPHLARLQRPGEQDRKAIAWALQKTDTARLAERPFSHLSSGERQRVWLAMALAQQPQILLLDEPTSHLDINFQLELLGRIRSLAREGLAVIMSLHDLTIAGQYADRVALFRDGRIFAIGAPEEVLTADAIATVYGATVKVLLDDDGRFWGVLPLSQTAKEGQKSDKGTEATATKSISSSNSTTTDNADNTDDLDVKSDAINKAK